MSRPPAPSGRHLWTVPSVAGLQHELGRLDGAAYGDQLVADLLGEAGGLHQVHGALLLLRRQLPGSRDRDGQQHGPGVA